MNLDNRVPPGNTNIKQRKPPEQDFHTENPYDPRLPQKNVIFWGTPTAGKLSILERIRLIVWFLPDYVVKISHSFRPISYLVFFYVMFLGATQVYSYAQHNPASTFSSIPDQHLIEGAVGSVSSLNPLYITHNQIERDLQSLIFNRLIRIGADGNPRPELAESWAKDETGTQYTFFIRKGITWHDGEPFNADDVIFTFKTVQSLGSDESFQKEFENVSLSKVDDYTVVFSLPETNPTLMDALAFPIVPEHILRHYRPRDIRFASFNTQPVGTGPFMIDRKDRDSITLKRNTFYYKGTPKLEYITYRFYPQEEDVIDALKTFQIHTSISPTETTLRNMKSFTSYIPYQFTAELRQKVIYFNLRNSGPLAYSSVRRALSAATDRETLVNSLTEGGTPSTGPIPQSSWAYDERLDTYPYDPERAGTLLGEAGWHYPDGDTQALYREQNGEPLTISIVYLENAHNTKILSLLSEQWAQVGIHLELSPQSYERISSETVPRRNFDALLFEIESTPDPDKYNFWHSSSIEFPGLNLSGYSYERVDILLERARTEINQTIRARDYSLFQLYILNDMPALYLYHPNYNFIAHDSVHGIELDDVLLPHHRYLTVEQWYIER